MENISISKVFNFDREPCASEYKKGGIIYCAKCNEPRQQFIDIEDCKKMLVPVQCRCQKAERAAEEERERRTKVSHLRDACITNPTYRSFTLANDDGQTPKLTNIIKRYINNFGELVKTGQGLLLWGSVGTGKTFYACCIANAVVDKLYSVHITSLGAVIKLMQDFDNARQHLDRLMAYDLIVVDDLGVERNTQFATEQIYAFIDGCNTHNIPLIITTNLTPSILEKASQDTTDLTYARIYSRILERCFPVKVNEVKRRENNARQNKSAMAKLLGVGGGT